MIKPIENEPKRVQKVEFRVFGIRMVTVPEWMASLQPFPLNECFKSSNCPAVRIQNDLSQGGDAEGDVGAVGTVNNNVGAFLKTQNVARKFEKKLPNFRKNPKTYTKAVLKIPLSALSKGKKYLHHSTQ